jgi:protein-S-isoprenylcysteine O-methyltransferase Ste14
MVERSIPWREAWSIASRELGQPPNPGKVRHTEADRRLWRISLRISVGVTGGLLLGLVVLLDSMWRSTAGDVAAQNALGALAVLLAFSLIWLFGLFVASLIGLGIHTRSRLERILSWSAAVLTCIWLALQII